VRNRENAGTRPEVITTCKTGQRVVFGSAWCGRVGPDQESPALVPKGSLVRVSQHAENQPSLGVPRVRRNHTISTQASLWFQTHAVQKVLEPWVRTQRVSLKFFGAQHVGPTADRGCVNL